MAVTLRRIPGALLIVLCFSFACGGRTIDDAGDEGGTGALATCGDDCSLDQVAASCAAICGKMAETGCLGASTDSASCVASCSQFTTTSAPCKHAALAFLRCLDGQTPTCTATDKAPQFVGCDAESKAADDCGRSVTSSPAPVSGSSDTTGSGGAGPSGPDGSAGAGVGGGTGTDPSICSNIPRSAGSRLCSGSGSAGGYPDAAIQCLTSCQDGAGNTWEANCLGSTCTCTYNHSETCTCTGPAGAGACASCCPGLD